ncbi:DnaJ domain-containing protein [Cynara cardunculus var. scolymus]|uniref:DnaJ domain-containing protein n=1 Tax=Cynara cardunculus var. scolymus TaxID=59895 RepID=A0A103XBU0_CYNCS|nr:DnaJ domain-containing protein [Cynara cardunculus var. scolymus]
MQTTSRAEAERLLGIAEKLLEEKDLNAARDFALLAQETEPLLNGSDRIMAIADVLIAADKQITDNHHHWYAILQIAIHRNDDSDLIKQQYRRLALLLHPDKNKFPFAGSAFKLVRDAWEVLSDSSKKSAYDEKLFEFLKVDLDAMRNQKEKEIQNPPEKMPVRRNSGKEGAAEIPPSENIWTSCPYCYNLFEYPRVFDGYCLRCANCERAFQVVAIPPESMPPLVPGKEAYYCSFAYFPMRFAVTNSDTAKTTTKTTTVPIWMPNVNTVSGVESDEDFGGGRPPESQPMPKSQKKSDSLTTGVNMKER